MSTSPRPRSQSPRKVRERGAAAVELAIVFPLLFLIVAGIIDFGRFFYMQIQVTTAAREGVRAAVMYPDPDSTAKANITARATAGAPGLASVSVTGVAFCPAAATNATQATATVAVSVPFDWILIKPAMGMIGGGWAPNGPISATGVMQCGG